MQTEDVYTVLKIAGDCFNGKDPYELYEKCDLWRIANNITPILRQYGFEIVKHLQEPESNTTTHDGE